MISINFSKRDELLFITVFAFPNASKIGFEDMIFFSIDIPSEVPLPSSSSVAVDGINSAKKYNTFFVVSVSSAPDSPPITHLASHRHIAALMLSGNTINMRY